MRLSISGVSSRASAASQQARRKKLAQSYHQGQPAEFSQARQIGCASLDGKFLALFPPCKLAPNVNPFRGYFLGQPIHLKQFSLQNVEIASKMKNIQFQV